MNEKEIGELRRHIRRDRSNITAIYGCYVNGDKEIVSTFRQSVSIMPENEAERYFGVLKRTLSGTVGKNLIDICFRTSQVANSPEHRLLMDLRSSGLKDDALRMSFFQKVIQSVSMDDNYVILIACDNYDVPFKSKDGDIQSDVSDETFTYLLCAICPVKLSKANLSYDAQNKEFHDSGVTQVLCPPELGFLFPAFDDRSTNIYNALFYTHNIKLSHQCFVDSVFNTQIPKPAAEQRKSFESLLTTSLNQECSYEVVQTVHEQLCKYIEMHKESKIPEPLLVSKEQVKEALHSCGISQKNIAKFSVDYDEAFGFEAELHPKNVIDNRRFEIKTPDISIKVDPNRTDLIQTRVIDGVKYILICADENVEVNGVSIHIGDNDEA